MCHICMVLLIGFFVVVVALHTHTPHLQRSVSVSHGCFG